MKQKPGMEFKTGCIVAIGSAAMIWQGHWLLLVLWLPFCWLFLRGPNNGL